MYWEDVNRDNRMHNMLYLREKEDMIIRIREWVGSLKLERVIQNINEGKHALSSYKY